MKGLIVVAGGDAERNLLLRDKLESHRYTTAHCCSITDFKSAITERSARAIILLYPDENELVDEIYKTNITAVSNNPVPIVFISASRQDNDRARSLHYKAYEFLIEPILLTELIAIVDQIITAFVQTSGPSLLRVGDLVLDRASLTVNLRNATLPVGPIEARILACLMLKPGRAFARREISNAVWGSNNSVDDRAIDVYVARIRDVFKHRVSIDPIRTVRNAGYAFSDEFAKTESRPKKGRVMKPGF
jgi:two-component system phosphate regulon response regulator PhoB